MAPMLQILKFHTAVQTPQVLQFKSSVYKFKFQSDQKRLEKNKSHTVPGMRKNTTFVDCNRQGDTSQLTYRIGQDRSEF